LLVPKEGSHDQILGEAVLGKAQALLNGFAAYHKGVRKVESLCLAAAQRASGTVSNFRVTRGAEG
jgi:hypothetical protein